MNLKVMQAFLARPGFATRIVTDGNAAVDAAAQEIFDVVLMDLRMPGIDGIEAARRIRALPGPVGAVHIIAVTADVNSGVERRCREAGMDDFLAKPVRLAVLDGKLAALARALPSPRRRGGCPKPIAAVQGAVGASFSAGTARSPRSR